MANSTAETLLIINIAIAVPIPRLFDYLPPNNNENKVIPPGTRVIVPFGRSKKVGFVIANTDNSDLKVSRLKRVIEVLDDAPLISTIDLQLLRWASNYYHYPLGEVISAAFPASLRKGKPAKLVQEKYYQI